MKILIINIYYYPNNIGGTESVVHNLAENLVQKGNEVAIFSADSEQSKMTIEDINGVKVYRGNKGRYVMPKVNTKNPLHIKIRNNIRNRYNPFIKKELEYVCDDFKPDVIHTHNLVGISTLIWKLCAKKKIPLIHTIHDYWLLDKRFYKWAKRYSKYPNIVTAPSKFVLEKFESINFFSNAIYKVVPNGVKVDFDNLEKIVKKKQEKKQDMPIKFLYVGQLGEIKGIDRLLKSFFDIKDSNITLTICGKGSLEPLVESFVERDPRIFYKGQVSKAGLEEIYEESDVLVVPSVWEEPFGMVAIEAYAYGLAVIAGRRGGLIDIINHVHVGQLIDPTNEFELKNSLLRYVDRELIKNEIVNIKNSIGDYSLDYQVEFFEELYQKILKESEGIR